MPYVREEQRPSINKLVKVLVEHMKRQDPETLDGQMNYAVTRLMRGVYGLSYREQNRAWAYSCTLP